jgi:hypothetical protein
MEYRALVQILLLFLACVSSTCQAAEQRRLYVASPGIRNYLEYGGHGILVYDIDDNHRLLRRISLDGYGLGSDGKVLNIKGICASDDSDRLYVSTLRHLICLDLRAENVVWQREFRFGCDRMSISPDGTTIYLPSLENDMWYVVDAASGAELKRLIPKSAAHNTVYGLDGSRVYLAGLKSPLLGVADTRDHTIQKSVGPFSNSIRPFTVNGKQTLCFVTVNGLLGFEIGDLRTGQKLHTVAVQGFEKGPVKRHGCPSHGVGLTPDEREIWVCDAANQRLHVFDATVMPPKQIRDVKLREQPGWITFSIDGSFGYPSTGDVIDTKTYRIVTALADEKGREVHSEKLLEIDFEGDEAVRAGDQFGLGRVVND